MNGRPSAGKLSALQLVFVLVQFVFDDTAPQCLVAHPQHFGRLAAIPLAFLKDLKEALGRGVVGRDDGGLLG